MKKEIKEASRFLSQKKLIIYPTDTIYGIGCDATCAIAIEKIYKLKQRDKNKSLIILVSSLKMLQNYIKQTPKLIVNFLKKAEKPTTVIYKNPINLAQNVIAKDSTIAIRIVSKGFCYELIKKFGKPIVSTSVNISKTPTPLNFKEIDKTILSQVDYVVNLPLENTMQKSSKIITFIEDKIIVLRE